ncbi:MAG: nitrous oxide reductase family maturation protein NosD [Burkholderiales bacterium]|nr:nitrous oxide reductase family maturation protein NosD [Burkholderiales bacterium]
MRRCRVFPAALLVAYRGAAEDGRKVPLAERGVSGKTAPAPGDAATADTPIRAGEALQPLLDTAHPGQVLRLGPGRHAGPLTIRTSLALVGEPGALIAGDGKGSVITIEAADVRIEGLEITGSGTDLPGMDSAIFLRRSAERAQVRSNRVRDNLFGVYVHGAAGSVVADNLIIGRSDLRLAEAGDGVAIWNAPGTQVVDNRIERGRDGIHVITSRDNAFERNRFSHLRFAIHYMYTHDSRIVANRSRGNHVAWALMYSQRLSIRDNVSDNDRDHGLLLNTTNASEVSGNVVRHGGNKCAFVYNAHRNVVRDNWLEGCPIGIHFTAGSEGNIISGNAFVANRTQVKYAGTRLVDWGRGGRGNYWSDNVAFDLDGDGIADRPYRPNDVMDVILWRLPAAKVLTSSPAVQMVRWAQARFPALYPGGVVDSAPLMRPPRLPSPSP